ncbi:MAG: two-component system chemotaxis family sensor kinase [Geobacteraceae bacterium]|nr:MAG: two-component system chemotaxis family sensor kinase [Geobacteraceae bacterium]
MMDDDFQKRLLATFKVETKERLAALSSGLIALEKATEHEKRQEILEAVFREAHSMKGAARAVSMAGIESLSHALESVFAQCKRQEIVPSPALFDLLHRTTDTIETHLYSSGADDATAEKSGVRELILSLEKGVKGAPSPPAPPPAPPQPEYRDGPHPEKPAVAGTVRISAGKLDSLLHQAEEMLTAKISARQRAAELDEISAALASWEKEWKKVRPAVRRLRKVQQSPAGRLVTDSDAGQLGKLLAFFDWNHAAVKSLENRVHNLAKAAANDRHLLDGMVDALLGDLKEVLMLPCSTILEVLPKMVRDLGRDRGKEAELAVTGETVEIDKRVLEEMKDPLIHLVRNCIDHGIEKPEERKRRSKPACGRITVAVSLIGTSRIEMVVADDGAGMDTAMLADVAVQQGVITRDEASRMGNEESLELIFKSGVSTSPIITDLSGRGLGLAIVREKVEKLGGTVTVISEPLRGTTFRMVLPLTLSTYRGVLVSVGEQTFIVPSAGVERVARIGKESLKTAENRETVELDGVALSFVRLADLLQIPRKEGDRDDDGLIQLFLIGSGSSRIAFGVDGILGEQEVLVKSLGPQLPRVRNIAGATVLGTGKVATILHPGDLVKSAAKGAAIPAVALSRAEREEVPRKSVLIAEDSITARTLLKNILETAGYRTSTAVDGIDALTQLRTEQIDLVVSDVDMPRMNGFDLTARIRKSREIADLPVVLVTSLDSREDRERGIEAGANAYIVKSSFDQSNLLEVIRRLI